MSKLKNWSKDTYSLRDEYGVALFRKFNSGSFSVVKKNQNEIFLENLFTCREEFQKSFFRRKKIIFTVKDKSQAKKVASLIESVEKKLKLKDKTLCGMTNNPNTMWLFIGKFWSVRAVRRSLFTAILRAGLKYDKNLGLNDNLFKCDYLNRTQKAVKHFMNGNTKSTTPIRGWYATFYYGTGISEDKSYSKFKNDKPVNVNKKFISSLLVKK